MDDPTTMEAHATGDGGGQRQYHALCERAIAFIEGRGGAVHEELLIGHVFGNSGSMVLWRPLLRSVLQSDERVVFRADGFWALAGPRAGSVGPSLLDAFVAIDVETTGLRPLKQRVIEVALYRYQDGHLVERFETLVNPDRQIPAFISNLTTITNGHVEDAPRFADIAAEVTAFIGDALLVGHNVAFDVSFINAELKRADHEQLVNERLDTMGLSMRLLPGVRKASLDRVATAVGLSPRKIHRAGRDAELTAEVALRLVDEAVRQGVTSLNDLKVASTIVQRRPRDNVGRGRAVMDRAWLADVPKKPGVYVMRDQLGQVIYVGKAKNLRDRVSSYYSQPLGYTRKMDGLLESMVQIDTEVVGSELQALILESQLIQRFQPRYNTVMRSFEHYPYIKIDITNPWPRITLAKVRKDDGARYFGPYRSASSARRTVDVINSAVPLRTCTRSFKNARSYGKPCIRLDLGKCLGPCVGQTIRDEYQEMVHDVVDFLEGKDRGLRERLWAELEAAAARLDFERASKLRKDLRSALALIAEQTRLRSAEAEHTLVLVQPSSDSACRELMIVLQGRAWGQVRVNRVTALEQRSLSTPAAANDMVIRIGDSTIERGETGDDQVRACIPGDVSDVADRLRLLFERYTNARVHPVDHYQVDETNILNRWLFKHHGHPAIIPIDLERVADRGYLVSLVTQALSLNDSQLATEGRADDEPVEDDEGDTRAMSADVAEGDRSQFGQSPEPDAPT
jgi:DNA polymerase III epsilon subunit family exonuclease